ncbi:uncharacterized protein [Argopecten irradians]|uniref:uncharacterized protein n=1 Tax=Argopecten irradians TaxID=31199 RepID=UPI003712F31A
MCHLPSSPANIRMATSTRLCRDVVGYQLHHCYTRRVAVVMISLATVMIIGHIHTTTTVDNKLLDDSFNETLENMKCFQEVVITSDTTEKETLPGLSVIRENNHDTKYIVYDCSDKTGVCGGWSDRISGILTTFIISLLTQRRFYINFNSPCTLQNYLIPAQFEWRYDTSFHSNRTHFYQDLFFHEYKNIKAYFNGSKDINMYFKHDVNFLRTNWDFTEDFRKRPTIGCEVPWITKLQYADMYQQLFNLLFKPAPVLIQALRDHNSKQRTRPKLACAHVRLGGTKFMADDKREDRPLGVLWKYFDQLNKTEYDMFVASDTKMVKELARRRFPRNIIDTPGTVTHIDNPDNDHPCEGFLKQLLDFYILANCDILIITRSGFGMLAAYVREVDAGLYCWSGRYLRPCSRHTIHNVFPGEMLAPS